MRVSVTTKTRSRWRTSTAERRSESAAGFTLLELLVAITVVSLLATAVLFSWRVASSAWQKVNQRLETDRTILATHQLLQEQMASLIPYRTLSLQGSRELFFQGEPEAARFVSRYSLERRARSGLYEIAYQVEQDRDGSKRLLLRETPLLGRDALSEVLLGAEMSPEGKLLKFRPFERDSQVVVLLENLQECRFEYYQPRTGLEAEGWVEAWRPRDNELPRAMRIRAVGRAQSGTLASDTLVAAIRNYSASRE